MAGAATECDKVGAEAGGVNAGTASADPTQLLAAYQRQLETLTSKVAALERQLQQRNPPAALPAAPATAPLSSQPAAAGATDGPASAAATAAAAAEVPEAPSEIRMSATRVVMHEIVLPSMGDFMAICYGG